MDKKSVWTTGGGVIRNDQGDFFLVLATNTLITRLFMPSSMSFWMVLTYYLRWELLTTLWKLILR